MTTLPLRTLVRNAAAVFAGSYGAVTDQAHATGCSRQTLYKHARQVEHRLDPATTDHRIETLQAENRQLRLQLQLARQHAEQAIRCDPEKLRQVATVSFAAGITLRQIALVFATWLDDRPAPRHATIGRWVEAEAAKATALLKPLDAACVPLVSTLAGDEVFFGGSPLWSVSSRTA
jgi:transposase-like protein